VSPALFDDNGIVGGGERYALELAKAMARFTSTRLLAFGPRNANSQIGPLRIYQFEPNTFVDGIRANPLGVKFVSKILDADVIHCHQFHTIVTDLSVLLGKFAGKRVFVTDLGGGGRHYSLKFRFSRLADGHIAISRFAAESDFPYFRASAVNPGGVDEMTFRRLPVDRKRRFLFVGRLMPHKGIDYLIDALPDQCDLLIDFVEDPNPAAPRYRELLLNKSQGKRVVFRENKPQSDSVLVEEYNTSLATVLPSVYVDCYGRRYDRPELQGLAMLESMSCQTPVICTDVGGLPEIVENGETGFIVPPNDPCAMRERMLYFLKRPAESDRMGRRGRERILAGLTWKDVAARCLEEYQKLS
jgi:glycosyltransferase involved in cell wall biosynthesis